MRIVVMNFSGIYHREQFYRGDDISWVEVREIPGTNCYCDEEAMGILRARIAEFPAGGIHFLDSGNYHYMSRIWLEKIDEPFRLLVFDNHTDMQLPAFGGLLSCGGWIASALMELEQLKEIVLVGPDEEAFAQVEPELARRVRFLSREALAAKSREELREFFAWAETDLPLYISLDKDVLCREEAHTTWSQGDMTLAEMTGYLTEALGRLISGGGRLLGVDICGECDAQESESSSANDAANRALMEFFRDIAGRFDTDKERSST